MGGDSPGIAVAQLMNSWLGERNRGQAPSHMGWRRALFQGSHEKAVHDGLAGKRGFFAGGTRGHSGNDEDGGA